MAFFLNLFDSPPSDFGNVQYSGNLNAQVSGTNNVGRVIGNCNARLAISNSKLDLNGNLNVNIKIDNCDLTMSSCPNAKIMGIGFNAVRSEGGGGDADAEVNSNLDIVNRRSKVTLRNDYNTTMELVGSAEVQAEGNKNSKIICKGSKASLRNNTNPHVECEGGGEVEAVDNANLKICVGSGEKAVVKRTKNLELKGVTILAASDADHDVMNKFEISLTPNTSSIITYNCVDSGSNLVINSSTMCLTVNGVTMNSASSSSSASTTSLVTNASSNVKFTCDFLQEAEVDGGNYKLGLFKFILIETSAKKYQVRLGKGDFDEGSFNVEKVDSTKIIVRGTKDGKNEALKICGPLVLEKGSDEVELVIDIEADHTPRRSTKRPLASE